MRILYDGSIYQAQAAGGVNRYFANLIARLPACVTPILSATCHHRLQYPRHVNLDLHVKGFDHRPKSVARWRRQRHFHRLYDRLCPDILHPTSYGLLSGQSLEDSRRPYVLTVYDMTHERFARLIDPRGTRAAIKRQAIGSARAIICVSHSTKRDLLEFCAVPEERVAVIHLAAGLDSAEADASAATPPAPFFVYVGSRATYKNFDRLRGAMRAVVARWPDCRLCVVGAPLARAEHRRVAELGLGDCVVPYGYATDGQLAQLYGASLALVYPSLYEGFGLPPLEAMRCGTVVVASDASSLPEVVDDAAVLFDPTSTDHLVAILCELLDDPGLRAPLIARGRRRAALFDWERTAARTIDVYQAVLDGEAVSGIDCTVPRGTSGG